jgi:GDP-L-fucose synthase
MEIGDKIYIAGHTGLVGSALCRALRAHGCRNIVTRTHAECDLTDATATRALFQETRPRYAFLAAAKVGGIHANNTYPADFIRDNLAIQTNVIDQAWRAGVERLLFLGSSCIYPKEAPQPLKETYLLTGPLEATNRAYALAKIAGVEMCWSYNRQHGTSFLGVMPSNLYGPGDNFHPENSHVVAALIRRFHEAKVSGAPSVSVWGTGTPRRELLYSEDMAEACIFLMNLDRPTFASLLGSDEAATGTFAPPLVNIGIGVDVTIRELALLIRGAVGYEGELAFDPSKLDGTPQKLMDVTRLAALGWRASTELPAGLAATYQAFLSGEARRARSA